jgi:hypothetical protein
MSKKEQHIRPLLVFIAETEPFEMTADPTIDVIYGVYVADKNAKTFLCSATPTLFLEPLDVVVFSKPGTPDHQEQDNYEWAQDHWWVDNQGDYWDYHDVCSAPVPPGGDERLSEAMYSKEAEIQLEGGETFEEVYQAIREDGCYW